jgi:anaerobic selenocysteine-containing dehydrogenase
LENGWYDKKFLSLPSMKAAKQMNRNVFTNSTHLVITEGKNKGKILRIKDTKLSGKPNDAVVINPLTKKPTAAENINEALLEWEGVIDGKKVKTAFKLMKESVFEHDLDFYSKECGIPKEEIFKTAKEFWENAPYSVAFGYHGGGNYMGGTYASLAYALLNAMVGNVNKKGGYLNKGKGVAKWEEGLYDLKNFPGKHKAKGVKISREKAKYEESTEFKKHGYPSKLPWFEFTKGGLSMSAISGIDQKYPYPIKVLITYFSDFVYSMPGGIRFAQTLKDKDKVPLFISIDHTINETNIYADYIVPDVTYLEGQYGFLTPHAPGGWFTGVRTPVFEPLTGKTKDGRHFNMEEFLIDVAKYLKLPGYGDNAIRGKDSKTYPLNRAEDYYLRAISNLAHNAKVKEADDNEIKEVEENYPVAKFKNILSKKEWKKVCYVLARGGIFKKEKEVFDKHGNFKFGIPHICIWNEKMATSKNTLSGKTFWGTVKHQVSTDYFGESIDKLDKDFKFYVITYKSALQTQSRSICHRQALVYEPDFTLKINPKDAVKLNLKDGDKVRVYSKSNKEGLITTIKITDLVGEGSVAYSYHFGHWQHGASSFYVEGAKEAFLGKNIIKGNTVKADKKRAVGILTNKLSRLDERMYNLPLVDPLGGIPDFSSTKVNIEKI